jgi:hypothetical protein
MVNGKPHFEGLSIRLLRIIDSEMQEALKPYGWDLLDFRNEYASVLTHWETPKNY